MCVATVAAIDSIHLKVKTGDVTLGASTIATHLDSPGPKQTGTYGWLLRGRFHEKLKRKKLERKKKGEKRKIWKVCWSNEHFNVWLNKSTVCSEQGREREKMRERSMENLLGPQDGGKAIQRNNGLLCLTPLSLSQYFQLLQLPVSLHIKCFTQKMSCSFVVLVSFCLKRVIQYVIEKKALHIDHLLSSTPFHLFASLWIQLCFFLLPLPPSLPRSTCSTISHYSFLPHIILSCFPLSLPRLSPLVYWFSRLRIPRVEDCNTQASNYFGVCLFAFPLHLFGLCL